MSQASAAYVAIDWGTSSFRSWLMSDNGTPLAESRGNEGMLHCGTAGFEPVLRQHLSVLGASADLPVLICGMAGARQGWVEAPYLYTPTRLDGLHKGAVSVPTAGDVRILPGIAHAQPDCPDVMRGEETQLLGVTDEAFSGLVCIPGTHSKWVHIEAGRVVSFSTYMTGELFSTLSQHSILMHAVESDSPTDFQTLQHGLNTALSAPSGLTTSLFRLRASQLLGFAQRADGAAHLSGLLIGTELADVLRQHGTTHPVRLIAAGSLGTLYASALALAGFNVSTVDAEQASRDGLRKAAAHLWGFHYA